MGEKIVVGRVSTSGWAITPEDKINAIFKHYQEASESSSTIYRGHVKSLRYAQFLADDDPSALASTVKDDIEVLLSSIFPDSELELSVSYRFNEDKTKYDLDISGSVNVEGNTYQISKYVEAVATVKEID